MGETETRVCTYLGDGGEGEGPKIAISKSDDGEARQVMSDDGEVRRVMSCEEVQESSTVGLT